MKSAYELAMERLEKRDGKPTPLTADQKRRLAEVESAMKSKIAETEIMMQRSLAEARAAGDAEKASLLEKSKADEILKIRNRAEADREEIRRAKK